MKTTQYLDAIKKRYSLPSDYALAKFTGWSKQAVSQYRTAQRHLSDDHAIQAAKLLKRDPAEVIAHIHAERTKKPEERKVWLRIARQFGRAAAVFLLVGQSVMTHSPAQASGAQAPTTVYDVKSRRRRIRPLPAPVNL